MKIHEWEYMSSWLIKIRSDIFWMHILRRRNMKKKDLLTVVVPIYNVSEFLPTCIESLLDQTYQNLEIILINDGSTDNSGCICDQYAKMDSRIRVFHEKNAGLVATRKKGACYAGGEVVAFVDGDDWIDPDLYEYMMGIYKQNRELDMVSSGLYYEWIEKKQAIYDGLKEGVYGKDSIIKDILPGLIHDETICKQKILPSVCNKIFRKSILDKVLDKIDLTLTLGEDGAIMCLYLAHCKSVYVLHKVGYHYIQHSDSMIHKYDFDSFQQIYKLKNCLTSGMEELGLGDIVKNQVDHYIRGFLNNAIRAIYNVQTHRTIYSFPYDDLPRETKVILYGAGQVGYSYWKYIQYSQCVNLVGWADKDYQNLQKQGWNVKRLELLLKENFDAIIVAVEKRELFNDIKTDILKLGVKEEHVLWRPAKWKI